MWGGYTPFEKRVAIVPVARLSNNDNSCQFQSTYLRAGIDNLTNKGWLCSGYKVLPIVCIIGHSGYGAAKSPILYEICRIASENRNGELVFLFSRFDRVGRDHYNISLFVNMVQKINLKCWILSLHEWGLTWTEGS